METTARCFKALADPIRLRILALLGEGELCVCDLTAALGLPQSTVSRHLARLAAAGFVASRRSGTWMRYRLAEGATALQRGVLGLLARCRPGLAQAERDLAALRALKDAGKHAYC